MFENMNPMDRPTAFFEIAVLLLISFIIGFLAARIPIPGSDTLKSKRPSKKSPNIIDDEHVDPRDIITEPTSIKAILTRDRKGNPISPIKMGERKTIEKEASTPPAPPSRIAAIKKDYSQKAKAKKNLKDSKDKETPKED